LEGGRVVQKKIKRKIFKSSKKVQKKISKKVIKLLKIYKLFKGGEGREGGQGRELSFICMRPSTAIKFENIWAQNSKNVKNEVKY
jgi:hypothetical protein